MKAPIWLTHKVVFSVHEELLARFGGLSGLRDEALLDSALNRPRNTFAYDEPDLFDLAAEYALGIVKNHPFLDGNKRTAFMAVYIFLGLNGQDLDALEEKVVIQTRSLASGEISCEDYAMWLKLG